MFRFAILTMLAVGQLPEADLEPEPEAADELESSDTWVAMRKHLAKDKVKMEILRREEASILGGLLALDQQLDAQAQQAEAAKKKTEALREKMAWLDEKLAQNDADLAKLRQQIGRRVAAIHRLKRTRIADLVKHVSSPGQAVRLRDRIRRVLAYDGTLLRRTREASKADRELRAAIRIEADLLELQRVALSEELELLESLRDERGALLEGVKAERKSAERLASELQSAARRLEKELGKVRGRESPPEPAQGGFREQRGRLPWPAAGRLEAAFGKTVDPSSGMVLVQKGIDLRAPLAAPVRAVFGGRVVFASWMEGYGRLLVIDHGSDCYSLYAHLESFVASKDQAVNQHQVIGYVGDTGSTKGTYLYFEIRTGKDAVDPMEWLAR